MSLRTKVCLCPRSWSSVHPFEFSAYIPTLFMMLCSSGDVLFRMEMRVSHDSGNENYPEAAKVFGKGLSNGFEKPTPRPHHP